MMSILKRQPRHEVISVRLTEDRLKLLERHRKLLSEQLGREVSLGEAAFLVIDERAALLDRDTQRQELLGNPTASLYGIRKKWESQHELSLAEWDVLALYIRIGAEDETQEPPLLWPAIPSRESYLALLDSFEAVYPSRKNPGSKHASYYLRNLGGDSAGVRVADESPEQKHQALLKQIAARKQLLKSAEKWERPGSVAGCLLAAFATRQSRARNSIKFLHRSGRLFGHSPLGAIGCGTTANLCVPWVPRKMIFAAALSCPIRFARTNSSSPLPLGAALNWPFRLTWAAAGV